MERVSWMWVCRRKSRYEREMKAWKKVRAAGFPCSHLYKYTRPCSPCGRPLPCSIANGFQGRWLQCPCPSYRILGIAGVGVSTPFSAGAPPPSFVEFEAVTATFMFAGARYVHICCQLFCQARCSSFTTTLTVIMNHIPCASL